MSHDLHAFNSILLCQLRAALIEHSILASKLGSNWSAFPESFLLTLGLLNSAILFMQVKKCRIEPTASLMYL